MLKKQLANQNILQDFSFVTPNFLYATIILGCSLVAYTLFEFLVAFSLTLFGIFGI